MAQKQGETVRAASASLLDSIINADAPVKMTEEDAAEIREGLKPSTSVNTLIGIHTNGSAIMQTLAEVMSGKQALTPTLLQTWRDMLHKMTYNVARLQQAEGGKK